MIRNMTQREKEILSYSDLIRLKESLYLNDFLNVVYFFLVILAGHSHRYVGMETNSYRHYL